MNDEMPADQIKTQQPLFALLTATAGLSLAFLFSTFFLRLVNPDAFAFILFNLLLCSLGLINSLLHFILVRSAPSGELGIRSVRQFSILVILAYLLFSLITVGDGFRCLLPGLYNLSGVFALAIAAIADFRLRIHLFSRQTLYRLIAETTEDSLAERFSRQQEIVFDAYEEMKTLRQSSMAIMVIAILLMTIEMWIIPLNLAESLLFSLLLVSCTGLLSLANTYAEEHRFFLFGIATPFRFQRIRQNWAYGLIIICLLPALLLAGERSLVDPRVIGMGLAWLASLLQFGPGSSQADLSKLSQALAPALQSLDPGTQNPFSGLNLSWVPVLFSILKWLGSAAILTGLVWFLTKPLFEKGFTFRKSIAWFAKRLWRFAFDPLLRLAGFFKSIIRFLGNHLHPLETNGSTPVSIRSYLKHLMSAASSQGSGHGKTKSQRLSLLIYGQYLEWAVKIGLEMHLADNPSDIAEKTMILIRNRLRDKADGSLADHLSEATVDIGQIRDLLESDLFSETGWHADEATTMKTCLSRLRDLVIKSGL